METIFEKPLDKQVAENTDHIANKVVVQGYTANLRMEYFFPVTMSNSAATVTLSHTPLTQRCGFAVVSGGNLAVKIMRCVLNTDDKTADVIFESQVSGNFPLTILYASAD